MGLLRMATRTAVVMDTILSDLCVLAPESTASR